MRKSRHNLYQWIFMAILVVDFLLYFTVFRAETKAVKDACWENPWFGLIMSVIMTGLLVTFLMLQTFELGRTRGIKTMADVMLVDPDNYFDFDERIMVTEKHVTGNKRRVYAVPLKYEDEDETKNNS